MHTSHPCMTMKISIHCHTCGYSHKLCLLSEVKRKVGKGKKRLARVVATKKDVIASQAAAIDVDDTIIEDEGDKVKVRRGEARKAKRKGDEMEEEMLKKKAWVEEAHGEGSLQGPTSQVHRWLPSGNASFLNSTLGSRRKSGLPKHVRRWFTHACSGSKQRLQSCKESSIGLKTCTSSSSTGWTTQSWRRRRKEVKRRWNQRQSECGRWATFSKTFDDFSWSATVWVDIFK